MHRVIIRMGYYVFICSCIIICCSSTEGEVPSLESVRQLAEQIGSVLEADYMKTINYDTLQNSYRDHSSSVRFGTVDAERELSTMAAAMSEIFSKRTQAVRDIVRSAEDASRTYQFDSKLELDEVDMLKMSDLQLDSDLLQLEPLFQRRVNLTESGVHTPLEVFEGYRYVLNGIRWAAEVDAVFEQNRVRDPALTWQYLASQLGVLRLHPATWWQPPAALPGVDLYDARRRSWYTRAAASPKDLLLLMDVSGSVYGQTFEIMKIAVKTVLNTLGEDDFVNVAWTTNTAGWADPCVTSLVPATMANRRVLFNAIDTLSAHNISNWAVGMRFAYQAFVDFYETQPEHAGARCHKVIMFFSDGGTQWPGEIIEHYRNHTLTQDVRMFTYALGPHPIPANILKKLACENGGRFTAIVASGAVRTAVQESYQAILARPLGLVDVASTPLSESSPYLDAGDRGQSAVFFSRQPSRHLVAIDSLHYDRMGLGFVTTVSMPVFNRSQYSDGQELLGVAAVDITINELLAHSPPRQLGPLAYTFAINANGILTFHPRLRRPLHYMQDAPDLDVTALEGDDVTMRAIRESMIRRQSGAVTRDSSLLPLDDVRLVVLPQLTYTYRPVEGTTLSVAMVMPTGQARLMVSGQPVASGLGDGYGAILAPSRRYCSNISFVDAADRWQQLSSRLRNGALDCDAPLVEHLVWDTLWTAEAARRWSSESAPDGVDVRFVSTESGLTRLHPANSSAELEWMSVVEPDGRSAYWQTALSEGLIVRSYAGDNQSHLVVTRRVAVTGDPGGINDHMHTLAVAGVRYHADWLRRVLSSDGSRTPLLPASCFSDAVAEPLHCWLLDEAALVVFSSRPDSGLPTAHFLGQLDAQLMAQLVNGSVFHQHIVYDQQGACRKRSDQSEVSAAWSLSSPARWIRLELLMHSLYGLLQWLQYAKFLVIGMLASVQPAGVSGLDEFGFEMLAYEHGCVLKRGVYRLNQQRARQQGSIHCTDTDICIRQYRTALVSRTNLLLVVSDPPCNCDVAVPPLPFLPVEDVGPDQCTVDQTVLFRRRRQYCYASDPHEKPFCSAAVLPVVDLLLLSAALTSCLLLTPSP